MGETTQKGENTRTVEKGEFFLVEGPWCLWKEKPGERPE